MKKSIQIAFCSIITAVSVVLMFLGGISFVFAYAVPMFAGALNIMLASTFSKSSAWITYIATSLLSLMLVADRECCVIYVVLFGYYPIIAASFNKIKPKVLCLIVKLVFFNITFSVGQLVLVFLFHIPFLEEGEGKIFIAVFAALMNVLFIIYDKFVEKITIIYKAKLESKIKKLIR